MASGINKADGLRSSTDNYFDGRRKESTYVDTGRLNGQIYQSTTEAKPRNYGDVRQSTTYRPRTSQDFTPRGFSKDNNEELAHAEARGFVR